MYSRATGTILFTIVGSFLLGRLPNSQQKNDLVLEKHVSLSGSPISFESALHVVSQQLNRNVMADDVPIRSEAPIAINGPARLALDAIGSQFDYTWKVAESGDICFLKRFSNAAEQPQVSREETLDVAWEIGRVAHSLGVRPSNDSKSAALNRLVRSLSAPQLMNLQTAGRLRAAELHPEQRQQIETAVLHSTLGPYLEPWELLWTQLESLDTARLTVTRFSGGRNRGDRPNEFAGPPSLVLTFAWTYRGKSSSVLLPHLSGLVIRLSDGPISPQIVPRKEGALRIMRSGPDNGWVQKLKSTRVSIDARTSTIREIIAELRTTSEVPIEAQSSLMYRRLFVSIPKSTAHDVLQLVCSTFDLEWGLTEKGVGIGRRKQGPLRTLPDIIKAMPYALPGDWRRFLRSAPKPSEVGADLDPKTSNLYWERFIVPHVKGRITQFSATLSKPLRDLVIEQGEQGNISCSSLTPELTDKLIKLLTLDALGQLFESPKSALILLGRVQSYEADPSSAEVEVKDGHVSLLWREERDGLITQRGIGARMTPSP